MLPVNGLAGQAPHPSPSQIDTSTSPVQAQDIKNKSLLPDNKLLAPNQILYMATDPRGAGNLESPILFLDDKLLPKIKIWVPPL